MYFAATTAFMFFSHSFAEKNQLFYDRLPPVFFCFFVFLRRLNIFAESCKNKTKKV